MSNRTWIQQLGLWANGVAGAAGLLWRLEGRLRGVEFEGACRMVGRPILSRAPGSRIRIGDGVELNSAVRSNPMACFQPCLLRTQAAGAEILLGPGVGLSGAVWINYTDSVQQAASQRMIAERKRIAERSRSEGQGRAAEIRGQKERDVLAASSVGYRSAQDLKGKADAKATTIYARAYGRDPGFYEFFKSMDTLKVALDKDATASSRPTRSCSSYLKESRSR